MPSSAAKKHNLVWDDLRFVLVVARQGSLSRAARLLGLNHTTVLRRLARLEQNLGVRLFDRSPSGYLPTAMGEDIAKRADAISELVDGLERNIAGRDVGLAGCLRVTSTDTLVASILPPILNDFARQHPSIHIEVATSNAIAALTRREADVAVRPALDLSEPLFGRRIGEIAFAPYVSRDGVATLTGMDLPDWPWIGADASLAATSAGRWLQHTLAEQKSVIDADSLLSMRSLAEASAGVAFLPCYLGDLSPHLVRAHADGAVALNELWVVAHEDLRGTARVRAFVSFVTARLLELKPLLEGSSGSIGVNP